MAAFTYKATSRDGIVVEGVIDAVDEAQAVEKLRNSGVIPIKVSPPEQEGTGLRLFTRSSANDVLTFTTELSVLLKAGLPLDRSLMVLSNITESKAMKIVIPSILKFVREGSSLSDAMGRHPGVFSRLYVNMIRAGEAGGVLDIIMEKLVQFLESSKELREHIQSAMLYPIILLVMAGGSISFLMVYVMPKFSSLFEEFGQAIPPSTMFLMFVSNVMRSYWWAILLAAAASFWAFKAYTRTKGGRFNWDRLKYRMAKGVIGKLETARFSRTLGTLIKAGVPLLLALENVKDIVTNTYFASTLSTIVAGVREGKGISEPMQRTGVFPELALSMVKVGEETGQLDEMLIKVADAYEKSLRVATKRLMAIIGPALIVGMAMVIVFIVLSMLMAIMSVNELPF